MKRIALMLALLLVTALACAQTVYVNDATIAWDPPMGTVDGASFLETDIIGFEVYRQDRAAVNEAEFLGYTEETTFYTVVPTDRLKYKYFVRTRLVTDEGQTIIVSEFAVSPFDLGRPSVVAPESPSGIRLE